MPGAPYGRQAQFMHSFRAYRRFLRLQSRVPWLPMGKYTRLSAERECSVGPGRRCSFPPAVISGKRLPRRPQRGADAGNPVSRPRPGVLPAKLTCRLRQPPVRLQRPYDRSEQVSGFPPPRVQRATQTLVYAWLTRHSGRARITRAGRLRPLAPVVVFSGGAVAGRSGRTIARSTETGRRSG